MRTWGQLTDEERSQAIAKARGLLIGHLYEGIIEITMPEQKLQKDFEAQIKASRKKNSVELFGKLIAAYPAIRTEVDKISIAAAQGSRYDSGGSFLM